MFTAGADPEFFVVDSSKEDTVIPVCGVLGGTKDNPIPIPGAPPGFYMQEDNIMGEFNIPPATSASEFVENVETAMRCINQHIPKIFDANHRVLEAPSAVVHSSLLTSEQSRVFGCSPDFDGYEYGKPLHPYNASSFRIDRARQYRFAAGHLHLGYPQEIATAVPCYAIAQMLDLFVYCYIYSMDVQGQRASFYGTPGRYRQTSYGIEYRTPSNRWLFSRRARESVALSIFRFLKFLQNTDVQGIFSFYASVPWSEVRYAVARRDKGRLEILAKLIP